LVVLHPDAAARAQVSEERAQAEAPTRGQRGGIGVVPDGWKNLLQIPGNPLGAEAEPGGQRELVAESAATPPQPGDAALPAAVEHVAAERRRVDQARPCKQHQVRFAQLEIGLDSNGFQWHTPIPVRLSAQDAPVEDAVSLDSLHLLVATDPLLCWLDLKSGTCAVFEPKVDGDARRVARDAKGRLWIAGRGLWRVDENRRAVSYPLGLPFLQDTDILDLEAIDGRLAVALGDRGLAFLDPDAQPDPKLDTIEPAGAFESRYGDGAVIVTFTSFFDANDQEGMRKLDKPIGNSRSAFGRRSAHLACARATRKKVTNGLAVA
jgi:hypothetical protein